MKKNKTKYIVRSIYDTQVYIHKLPKVQFEPLTFHVTCVALPYASCFMINYGLQSWSFLLFATGQLPFSVAIFIVLLFYIGP